MISLATTQAAVPNQSGSGGSGSQNFCYDEQNRLVWAGNSGTQPGAGNGTCGSATLSNSLSGASYTNAFVYTHLGQLWQGPLNGTGSQQQYLYCNSQSHELTGLYGTSATCSNKTGQVYASGYDAWGNVPTALITAPPRPNLTTCWTTSVTLAPTLTTRIIKEVCFLTILLA